MRMWLVLVPVLALALPAAPAAGQDTTPALVPMPAQTAAQARADSLARAALAATTPARRVFVDVRTPEEFAGGHLAGAVNIPLSDLEQRWPELKLYADRQIVLSCRSGVRAGMALELVAKHGIRNAVNGGGYESLRQRLEGTAK